MARLQFEQRIAATPALVGAFFVPQRMPYWYGHEMKAEFEVSGGAADFAAGQKVRVSGKLGAREMSLTMVVTRFELGRVLEWQFQDQFGVKGKQSWEIAAATGSAEASATQAAATIVRMRDEYEMPGNLARIVDALLTRHAVARRDRAWLDRLARLAERR